MVAIQSRNTRRTTTICALTGFLLTACTEQKTDVVPPRSDEAAPLPEDTSFVAAPIDIDQAVIAHAVERAVPRTLWTIDRHFDRCIQPQKVKIFGKDVKVTPPIGCTVVGTVTRGAIRLHGRGREIIADIPIRARISARDVGGVLKGETATGAAMVQARILLDIAPDWRPRGTVRLHYDWTNPPGIDFLGQRITFADKADEKLAPIVRQLERDLPRELAKLDLRAQVADIWRQSFTTLVLNERNPPVWMRVTPSRVRYGGYHLAGGRLRFDLGVEARTATFVGMRPDAPAPSALPPLEKAQTDGRLRFFIPVIGAYSTLEPVIMRALQKRAQRSFDVPGFGPVTARFEKVEVYGSTERRIAVGITLAATPNSGRIGETRGVIWLTARPVNAPGSAEVRFEALTVAGDTNGVGGDLLIALGNSPGVAPQIAVALTQNFSKDLEELVGKIRRAVDVKREGDFVIRTDLADYETGEITAYGQGLYLPVRATGTAHIVYRPR